MPIGGKLVLKGGTALKGVEKKKKKQKSVAEVVEDQQQDKGLDPSKPTSQAPALQVGKAYEQEFEFETKRMQEPKVRNTPWGSSYRAPPEILHGYNTKVKGVNAQERLDIRCASKADKFCK